MPERKIVLLLILIMTAVSVVVAGVGTYTLYLAAFAEERARLVETAESQARLIEAVARFDSLHSEDAHPEGPVAATLSQIIDGHRRYKGFGKTGEFTLAKRAGDEIVFLLSHRHYDLDNPRPIPFDSEWGEPMRRALSGISGTVIGLDYRGVKVLAAHEPVAELNWGIVAKIDLAEVQAPFIKAAIITGAVGFVVVLVGAMLFIRVSNPLVRRLQQSEARTRAILETAADGILTISDRGVIESFNNAAEEIFGFAAQDVIGQSAGMLLPPSPNGGQEGLLARDTERRGRRVYRETVGRRRDGTQFPMELAISEVRQPGRPVFTAIVRDITERKEAEERLARTLAELERSNEELQQFANVASHDLQEPLRMVASYTQLLEKRYKDKLDGDASEFIQFAVDGATRMQRLIDDLLTYSRVGARPRAFEPADCTSVLDHAIADLRVSIDENEATIAHDGLPTVMGDPQQLRQLFQNLIGNAIKFRSAETPHIRIAAERNRSGWIFSVRDNGIGIDPRYKDRILVIFQRLHSTDEYPGTGIGLAICKRIVERHGGRIWMESEVGKGTTFYFTIDIRAGENHEYAGAREAR
ncbi:MAG: PAS domain S-box protein [Planctomycetota bacterium]|jgi:PAS domain S-box-containing protein